MSLNLREAVAAQELDVWNDLLDCGIASVALSKTNKLLAVGSANDLRNLLYTIRSELTSPDKFSNPRYKWHHLTVSGVNVLPKISKLERSKCFWDFGKQYKDANISRRAHLKIHTRTREDVPSSILSTHTSIYNASQNEMNNKFKILPDIDRVVLIVRDAEDRRPTEIFARNNTGSEYLSLKVDSMTHAYDEMSALGAMPFLDRPFWDACLARGLAMQIRWDFGITNSVKELETAVAPKIISEMGSKDRYTARAGVSSAFAHCFSSNQYEVFGSLPTCAPDVEAEVILRIVDGLSEVTMGVPGVSSGCWMLRRAESSDFSIVTILESADILMSIQQHQEGGIVRRSRVLQGLAIGYVIFAVIFSVLVGALNFGGRDNGFQRITDTASTATLLLVSVFGLVKLTSEDDNAIRNTLLGYKLLRNMGDVVKHYNRRREQAVAIETALAAAEKPLHWLADSNTCYMQHKPVGSIAFTQGIRASHVRQIGIVVGDKVTLDYRLNRSFVNSGEGNVELHVHMERKLVVTDLKSGMEVGGCDYTIAGKESSVDEVKGGRG